MRRTTITDGVARAYARDQKLGVHAPGTMVSWIGYWRYFPHFSRKVSGAEYCHEITPELLNKFIAAPIDGRRPRVSTMRARRGCINALIQHFYALRYIDEVVSDTLELPNRVYDYERAFTDEEHELSHRRASTDPSSTRPPMVLALTEATAKTPEVAIIRGIDVHLDDGLVDLPGCRDHLPRSGSLTPWGIRALRQHLDDRSLEAPLLDFRGKGEVGGYAAAGGMLKKLLIRMDLWGASDIGINSPRLWAPNKLFEQTGRIDLVARLMGCRSLDVAARLVGFDWTAD